MLMSGRSGEQTVEVVKVIPQERWQQRTQAKDPPVQAAQKTVEISQAQFLDKTADVPIAVKEILNVSAEEKSTSSSNQTTSTKERGHWSQTVFDHRVQAKERSQDEDEANKAKIDAKNGLKNHCVAVKLEAGNEEKTEKTVRDSRNWLDKNQLAENDDEMTGVVKPSPQGQFIEKAMGIPAGQQRQVHMSRTVQKNVQTPTKQSPDKEVDVPMDVASPIPTAGGSCRMVEVARVIPQERTKPAGESASVRERIRQYEMNGGISSASTVEFPRAAPDDGQNEDAEGEAPNKRRKQESDPDSRAPVLFSLCDGSSDQGTKSVDDSAELETRARGACEGVPVSRSEDILSEMRDVKTQLLQVRELVGVLVRRERCAEVKAEAAAPEN